MGCVIVREGRVIGRGRTARGGRPHAERVALEAAGEAARGATAYVSLEPCSHTGKTPPCAEALIKAGIARVVAPITDPDPRVAGRGFEKLRTAGIEVRTDLLQHEAEEALGGFLSRIRRGRPRVTLKLASSFDGRIATASGHSQWITGPDARRWVHAARARHDAVMVGGGTARSDDPALTVRDMGVDFQPLRIVVSRRLDVPLMSQLARTAAKTPVWICHGPDADEALLQTWNGLGAELLLCALSEGQLDLSSVFAELGARGLTSVFCEAGSALAASLLTADLVDELICFNAGFAIGAEGLPAVGALGLDRLDSAQRFTLASVTPIGGDVMQSWRRAEQS